MDRWRLRRELRLEREANGATRLVDPPLARALRLGETDARLVEALRRGGSVSALAAAIGRDVEETALRLQALSQLYVLDEPRSAARVALQAERRAFAEQCRQPASEAPIEWPSGRDPPRHHCVGTGTCCGATFLGPLTPADRVRVAALHAAGDADRPPAFAAAAESLFEEVVVADTVHAGMARGPSGACVAQGRDSLCDIHRAHGSAAKPMACRLFPLRLHRTPRGVHVSLLLACDGYDRARDAATAPWPSREAEVRALMAEGAEPVRASVPMEWAPGLPVPQAQWWALRDRLLACEPAAADGRGWLLACLPIAADAVAQRCRALHIDPQPLAERLSRLADAVASPCRLGTAVGRRDHAAGLRTRAATLGHGRDGARLVQLARALEALAVGRQPGASGNGSPLCSADPAAQRHLHDIVANDLAAHIAIGHLDAGLELLVRRFLLAEALACVLAGDAGRARVSSRDTTAALHVVYRSEPDLRAMAAHAALDPQPADADRPHPDPA